MQIKQILFVLAMLVSPTMAGDKQSNNLCNGMTLDECADITAANVFTQKPKPLTTRWVIVEAKEKYSRSSRSSDGLTTTTESYESLRIELGLRSDGVVVWK